MRALLSPGKRFIKRELSREATIGMSEKETLRDLTLSIKWGVPQEDMCPCLVGSSHIWLRRRQRSLAPSEALALQGLSHCAQREMNPPLAPAQGMELAGNAFCGAVLAPILAATFACFDTESALPISKKHAEAVGVDAKDGGATQTCDGRSSGGGGRVERADRRL